jgi:hypothetical protein
MNFFDRFKVKYGIFLSGVGTIGGAMSGAGQDLQKAGEWIKSK